MGLYLKCKETLFTIFQWKFKILKRDILQFPKNKIILKVSLEETLSTIFIICKKFCFILKVSLQETLSTIFQWKFWILKRDILQFPKNKIILKVSLQETLSTIFIICKKFCFILKVSLEETLSTIFQQFFSGNFEFWKGIFYNSQKIELY